MSNNVQKLDNIYDVMRINRQEAQKFAKEGGNVALFWAGQMAHVAHRLLSLPLGDAGEIANLLKLVVQEYNNIILEQTKFFSRENSILRRPDS